MVTKAVCRCVPHMRVARRFSLLPLVRQSQIRSSEPSTHPHNYSLPLSTENARICRGPDAAPTSASPRRRPARTLPFPCRFLKRKILPLGKRGHEATAGSGPPRRHTRAPLPHASSSAASSAFQRSWLMGESGMAIQPSVLATARLASPGGSVWPWTTAGRHRAEP